MATVYNFARYEGYPLDEMEETPAGVLRASDEQEASES
jgi:hypothetical protein